MCVSRSKIYNLCKAAGTKRELKWYQLFPYESGPRVRGAARAVGRRHRRFRPFHAEMGSGVVEPRGRRAPSTQVRKLPLREALGPVHRHRRPTRDLDAGIPSTAPGGLSTCNLLRRNVRSPKMAWAGRTLGTGHMVPRPPCLQRGQ